MFITPFLHHKRSNHNNILNLTLRNVQFSNTVTLAFKPGLFKGGNSLVIGIANKLGMSVPMVLCLILRCEFGRSLQYGEFGVFVDEGDEEFGFEEV